MAGGRRSGVQPITTVRLKVRSLDQVFNWCATDVHRIKEEMGKEEMIKWAND